ncbi:metalloendopeptidase [Tieghemiomyces parasiticus]|uniref:Metalloendopeptidase n=1 Tax=Tieghemiomyces parasiticus TaxID=78921 RepID=A0A9W8AKV9_9FUNG|nr:metalloendopeptidase [Tieghemiomyces parasiticus]
MSRPLTRAVLNSSTRGLARRSGLTSGLAALSRQPGSTFPLPTTVTHTALLRPNPHGLPGAIRPITFSVTPLPPPRKFNGRKPIARRTLYQILGTGGVLMLVYYVAHLEPAPISGRRRFMAVSPAEVEAMAKQSYEEIMDQYGDRILPANHNYTRFVKRVATRIIRASGMDVLGAGPTMDWEFYVIDAPEMNAFVLPGGKVFVFTGILPVARDEDGLATILGHEIAHQLAGHHAEKMSYAKFLTIFQFLLQFFIDPNLVGLNRIALELGIMLPNSRKCESEADYIGLQLMAQACYDPTKSIGLWERMSQSESRLHGKGFEYLQTHPSSQGRIDNLKKWLPEAEQKREDSNCNEEATFLTRMFPNYSPRW